jgi:hypothetical protein
MKHKQGYQHNTPKSITVLSFLRHDWLEFPREAGDKQGRWRCPVTQNHNSGIYLLSFSLGILFPLSLSPRLKRGRGREEEMVAISRSWNPGRLENEIRNSGCLCKQNHSTPCTAHFTLPLCTYAEGVSKRALQRYSKRCCVASVTKTFALKGVQTVRRPRCGLLK